MSWWLGAGVGFLRGGPVGALVGGSFEHFLTKKAKNTLKQGLPGICDQGLFVGCLVVALTRVAMVKNSVTQHDIAVIYNFFIKNLHYGREDLKYVDHFIAETRRVNPDLKPIVEQYRTASGNHYNLLLLALAYQILLFEDSLSEEAQQCINQLACFLGVSYEAHDRLRHKYSLEALKTPYTILGLKNSATVEEIKKAYRQLAGEYHPDRVAHKGEGFAEKAHLKFLEILSAYEELGKIHGFS